MIIKIKFLLIALSFIVASSNSSCLYAQLVKPVKWSFSTEHSGKNEATILITATIKDGWHIYSRFLEEGGPAPTSVTFEASKDYELTDKMTDEGELVEKFDSTFMIPIAWFEKKVVFRQQIKLKCPSASIKGTVKFMACTEEECLLPEELPFTIEVGAPAQSAMKERK